MAEEDRKSRGGTGSKRGSGARTPPGGSAGGSSGTRNSGKPKASSGRPTGRPASTAKSSARPATPGNSTARSASAGRSVGRSAPPAKSAGRSASSGKSRDGRDGRDSRPTTNRNSRSDASRDDRPSRDRDDRRRDSRDSRPGSPRTSSAGGRSTDSRSRTGESRGRPGDSRSRPVDSRSRTSDSRGRGSEPRTRPKDAAVAPTIFTDGLGDIDVRVLPRDVLRDLETLSIQTKPRVERWLAASRLAMEDDPDKAYEYAKEAGKLAGRVAVVRETVGIAAYQAGDYKVAKAELMAARRMAGRDILIPLLADCERALGKPQRALDIAHESAARALRGEARAELLLVESGARRDLGQKDAAAAVLRGPCAQTPNSAPWAVRLYYGYADALLDAGDKELAREWFMKALGADVEEETDADDRLAELDG